MPTPAAQVARSLRALMPRQEAPDGEAALKALLFKHRHQIAAALEREGRRATEADYRGFGGVHG